MKEYLYKNIWDYCEQQYPTPHKVLKWFRVLLVLSGLYYLLMSFAYLFAMVLAVKYESVDFVSSGQAVNLFIVMLISIVAEVVGFIFTYRKVSLCGVLLSGATALLSPFALWQSGINVVFKVHHLLAMLLLFIAQTVIWAIAYKRKKILKTKYDALVEKALSPHRVKGALLSNTEIEEILNNFNPSLPNTDKPLKRSQKNRIRKNKNLPL